MKKIIHILSLFCAFLATACTQMGLGVVNLPTHFNDITVSKDIAFGPEPWQKMDIYTPPGGGEKRLPVIVFYYGGRWESGSKDDYRFVGSALASKNYIVVIPDYRKYPQVKFPAFVQDAARSLAWVDTHIGEYGGDHRAIHVSGHSAGAHIASLLTVDPRYLKAEGKDRSKVIRDFVGLAGPYDFVPDEKDLQDMFGPPSQYSQMQATTFIDGRQPPMLLLWGDRDQYVGKINMDHMTAAIGKKGGRVETHIYPGIDHIRLIANLSWIGPADNPVLSDWMSFIGK
ncbi:MAG: esterase/lipase/thioesterase family protein [Micavibrio sp.]|nr:esterase/lipase/thioesterase family protein [Micavibrio sp.]